MRTFLLFALLSSWLASCAVNPVTGKRQLMLMSEADELKLGQETDKQVLESFGIYNDPALQKYISDLGHRMAHISHRPNLQFNFRLLDSPVINAFAVPGGYVYITRGILAYLNSEAELAGVMGHEIGHVAARHSAQQYSKAKIAQIGLGVGTIVSHTFRQFSGLAQSGLGLLFLRFSRDHERQADQLGVEYSTKVGYNAYEMANFFVVLEKMDKNADKGGLPGWLSTHPNPADRVVKIHQMAKEQQAKYPGKKFVIKRNFYLNKINGLVFGEDPREGYVEKNVFYHPDLRFQFPVPTGWKLQNSPSEVRMLSEDKKAAIIFKLSSQKTLAAAADKFIRDNKANVSVREAAKASGLPAMRVISDIKTGNGRIRVQSFFIRYNDQIYVFHGYSGVGSFGDYAAVFTQTMKSFGPLTDAKKIAVKPFRIRIKKVAHKQTLEKALKAFGSDPKRLKEGGYINGMDLTAVVKPGTLIKVIQK